MLQHKDTTVTNKTSTNLLFNLLEALGIIYLKDIIQCQRRSLLILNCVFAGSIWSIPSRVRANCQRIVLILSHINIYSERASSVIPCYE